MEQENAHDTIPVDTAEAERLALGKVYEPEDEDEENSQHQGTTHKTLLLSHCAEDKVGILLGHVFQLCLGSVQETLAMQSARTDGNLCLDDIIAGSLGVVLQSKENSDARLLVRLEHITEHIVYGIEETGTSYGKQGYERV